MAFDPLLPFQRRLLPSECGARLRAARESQGVSRRDVAAAVGIAPRTLARIERGQQKPRWETLDGLCDHLDVSVVAVARRWFQDSLDVPTNSDVAPGLGLRALRRDRDITLAGLARLSGVSASTLSRFERGLTTSRLLSDVAGEAQRRGGDGTYVGLGVARAFGFGDVAGLRGACRAAALRRMHDSSS